MNTIDLTVTENFVAYAKDLLKDLPEVEAITPGAGRAVTFKILDQHYRLIQNVRSGCGRALTFNNTFDITCSNYGQSRCSSRGVVINEEAPAKVAAYAKRRYKARAEAKRMQDESAANSAIFTKDYNARLLAFKSMLEASVKFPNPLEITGSPEKPQSLGYVTRSGLAVSLSIYNQTGGFNAQITKGFRSTMFTHTHLVPLTLNEFFNMVEMVGHTLS